MPYVSDDDSSSYDSDESCSSEEDDKLGMLGHFMKKEDEKKKSVTDFEAFGAGDEGTVVQKMNTLLALRAQLGMDDDQSFMAEQERKNAEKKMFQENVPEKCSGMIRMFQENVPGK